MRKYKSLRKEKQEGLQKYEQKACRKIISVLRNDGWVANDEDVYLDDDWGWIILADKHSRDDGVQLRRIKPFQLNNKIEQNKAVMLQERLRKDLVEVYPYLLIADKNRNIKVELLQPTFCLA